MHVDHVPATRKNNWSHASFFVRRFDIRGHCYGERIYGAKTLRECLAYLKDTFTLREFTAVERFRDTWTCTSQSNVFHYAIYKMRRI